MTNEPDFDIYADLDDAFTQPLDKDVAKEKAVELERLQLHEDLLKKVENLESVNKELRASNERLNRNLSIFTLTAKDEIARKDRQIADLRRELDDLKFRRRKVSTMNFERPERAVEVPGAIKTEVMVNPIAKTASSDRTKPNDSDKHQNSLKDRDEKNRQRSRSSNHSKSSEERVKSHSKRDGSRERNRGGQKSTARDKDEEQRRGSRSSNHLKPHEEHAKFNLKEKPSDHSSNYSRSSRKRSRSKSHEKQKVSENGENEKRRKQEEPRSKDRSRDKRKEPDLRKLLLKKQTPAPEKEDNSSKAPKTPSPRKAQSKTEQTDDKQTDDKSCNGAVTEETIIVEVPKCDDIKEACNQNHAADDQQSLHEQPTVYEISAMAAEVSLQNDLLDSSGASKENSLNQSREGSAKGPKSKRPSLQKKVTDDGVVIFTVAKKKSKKKAKETKI